MSLVNNEELKNLTNTTNGSINKQVVDFAKNILFSQLKSYISDEKQYKIINDKISNMKIELLSSPNFKDKFYESNGKGFLPAAFVYGGIIYFRNDINFDINDFHNLIHEMLHIISENGEKHGLLQLNKEKNYMYGRGLNEAFTEYLTSLVLEDNFRGYSKDFEYIIQLFMILTNLDINDLFSLYISKEEWLTDEIIDTFNPNNVLQFLFNSIKIKINNNEKLDTEGLQELLREYYNYYYDMDRDLEVSTKIGMAEILDILGPYKHKMSR